MANDLIYGQTSSGVAVPVQVDASGVVATSGGGGGGGGGGDASAANQVITNTKLDTLHADVDGLEALIGTSNTTLSAIDGHVDGLEGGLGAAADSVASTDTGTFSLVALIKRLLSKTPALGAATAANSSPVTLATDGQFVTSVGSLTETAPASDTASSGLNGRLVRIAQRLTTIIAGIPLLASEAHIGEVAGSGKGVKVALVVSTSPAYTSGDAIGGKITIANAARVSGGVSILASIHILDRANQKPAGTILIYDADPTVATLTDNAATVNSTDDLKVIATIPVAASDYTTINSKAYANLSSLAREVQVASGTTLYASFTTTSTPTFTATTDVQMVFGMVYVN